MKRIVLVSLIASVALSFALGGESSVAQGAAPSPQDRAAIAAASAAERDRELKVLGIGAMQPGVTAYDIGKPGNANYDEAKANP